MARKTAWVAFALVMVVGLIGAPAVFAQDDDGPSNRIMTVTTFKMPFGDRGTVLPWMEQYFHPNALLNPNVINYRWMVHNWGSSAAAVVIAAEYADWADIQAECGQPCDDWQEANPVPDEGTPEREEYDKAQALFNKYYAHHSDEIYVSLMEEAKTEGRVVGTVGRGEDDDDDDDM
jgi:hypothetical protein